MSLTPYEEMAAEAKADDRGAFERLISSYLPRLVAYAWALCGDYQTGQDVVQEVLLVAYRKRESMPPAAGLAGWLLTIVRFEALNARRKLARVEPLADELIDRLYGSAAPSCSPKQVEALSRCVESLVGRMSELVRAHYFGGLSLREIAPRLGLSLNATKQLLYRARLALRACVQKRLATETTS